MALRTLEAKWKAALVSILEELTEQEFKKLLFKLNTIPQGVKFGKTRQDIPHIIVQYYGTEKSISVIDKEMKLIPRNDAAVQQLLLPFVEKLKAQQQKIKEEKSKVTTDKKPKPAAEKRSKVAAESGLVAKKPKPAAEKKSKVAAGSGPVAKKPKPAAEKKSKVAAGSGPVAKKPKPAAEKKSKVAAGSGPVAKKPKPAAEKKSKVAAGSGPVAKKPKSAAGTTSKFAADSGAVAKKPKPAAVLFVSSLKDQLKSCRPDEMLPFGAVKPQQTVTQESSMQPTGSMETKMLPFGAVKPQQTVTQESSMQPTGSMETKMLPFGAVKPQQTVTQESSMQPTGSMETKMLPFGAVKPQQTVTQESSMQPTGSMETKMALRMLEAKWTAALVSILEELTEPQFSKLLFKLDSIPQGLKSGRTRQDIPHIIVQYYGTEESISVIDKEMKQIPRNDAAVQQLLLPFVENLKKKQQKIKEKKSKVTTESGPVAKKAKPAADQLKSCRPDEMLPFGAVKPQQTMTQESFMQPTGSMETKMLPFGAVKPQQTVTQESSMQPTGSMETKMLPFGAVKPQQTMTQESFMQPTGSMETKMVPVGAVKPQQTVTQESFMQATGSMETKVQSAAVQTGRITIIRIKRSNKFYTHLVVEFNDRLQTVFVTTRLLANAFGYIANDDFMERFSYEIPLTAEAKIQGNKIIEIKNR
ncbi:titin-like isoform X3 [Sebastes umbrosus]|uniref:titin-like isoform X3 n=1 Tax=Sebastes umbrosus TaxID=72105 RepID=UPI00189E3A7B|nr:titin-like isoform X3 [Sebastes umbrosus]